MNSVNKTGSASAYLSSYDTTNHSWNSVSSNYPITRAYSDSSSTTYAQISWTTGANAETYVYFYFDLSAIPSNATITSVSAKAKAYVNTTNSSRVIKRQMQLCSGTTLKGSALTISTSTNAQTFSNTGSWTRSELNQAGVRFYIQRGTSNTSSNYNLRIYGADITVNYSWQEITYEVNISNSTTTTLTASDATPLAGDDVIMRANNIEGIIIKDNNVDITSQFALTTETTGTYEITTRGTYGFELNSNGYYESENKGIDKSAAVCRISFNLPTTATVTFTFINYAEATYDFGVFGNLDTALNTDYYPANSSVDDTYKLACNTSTYNKSSTQTLTYSNVSAGEHYIDVKYSKDDATSSYNDTLQFKVNITYNNSLTYYGYTITNISADHNFVVIYAPKIFLKVNGAWQQYSKVYKKINGAWVEQSDLSTVFNTSANYIHINT